MKKIGPPSTKFSIRSTLSPQSDLTVRTPQDGVTIWNHKDVESFFNDRVMKWKPQSGVAAFLPCAVEKPYCISRSHKTYLYALREWIDGLDVYVLSEPMTVVPYELCDEYPAANYDYDPRLETEASKEIFASRLSPWLSEFLPHYERRVMIYRNSIAGRHYRHVFATSLDLCEASDKDFDEIACEDYSDIEAERIKSILLDVHLFETGRT